MEKKQRVDKAEKKRIELHTHTKLSEMDGVSSVQDYIATAASWGMDAIAITDHGVVQSFPKAQGAMSKVNKGRETPFKVIYGIEMNMVDPNLTIVKHPDERVLAEAQYCVLDLETTGLSSQYDHIIEFGGQIIEQRSLSEKTLQCFVKPPVPVSAFTTSLTGITQQDVDGGLSLEAALDKILAFIGDRVIIAHNAAFDMSFLNDKLISLGRKPLSNPVIDTLDLSRWIHREKKGHRLGIVARIYGVAYDDETAHRADYDTQVLAQIYLKMMSNELKDVATLHDLANLSDESAFNKVFKKHTTVLAKNAAGLKELFELVTLSHTKYLSYLNKNATNIVAEPRITREALAKARDNGNLLLGSSCANGELFELAQIRSRAVLKEAMQFYDYIEVQPLESYRFLVDRGSIESMERLQTILLSIVETADELGKIVVGTSDAHYVHPEQKQIRDIYIQSQAIGGVRHPLYYYNQEKRRSIKSVDAHLRTTDEMLLQYPYLSKAKTYEIVVDNTHKINEQIELVYPVKDKLYPPEIEGCADRLREICYDNARALYGQELPDIVEKRLEKELNSIIGNGFQVVYYISHLLVKKSLDDGYLVGSRGSVGSSFVATMSNITEVNPLAPHYVCAHCNYSKFFENGEVASGFDLPTIPCPTCGAEMRGDGQDIPFETFLGFEGDKVPDIDLNFSGEYQEVAHNYTKEVFGESYVYRAGTIGTVAEQTAFGYVKGFQEEMGLDKPVSSAQMKRLTKGCEGVKRTTGQHPGGIIVIPDYMDVHDFTPVQFPANNPNAEWKTTHFEFHDIHDNVLKLDILGHVDPTAMKLLEKMSGIDPKTIPINDPEVMKIFSSVESLKMDTSKSSDKTGAAGIPEFGTPFVRGILEMTKPTTFDELVRISGLSHGTDVWLNNAKDLIEAGVCTLKEVIGCRDDIMVYLLHKGLPPKTAFDIMEFVRKGRGLKDEWIPIMKSHNVEDWYIDSCRKIKYMFPKAHAVAYVLMAVRIAWFKVHYPQYYYAVYFSIRCDAYEIETMIQGEQAIRSRMSEIKRRMESNEFKNDVSKKEKDVYSCLELALEMNLRGLYFANIDIMKSHAKTFMVDPERSNYIIPPFTSIDGLGESVALSVVAAREATDEHGNILEFLSKEDLTSRTGLNGTHLKKLEAMGVVNHLQDENQLSLF
ncbi:MAG: PolC-type DNA polymerase III [Erysipelotrichaceae bacterium]